MKRLTAIILSLVLFAGMLILCSDYTPLTGNKLRFSNSVSAMKKLDGEEVTITGFMSAFETNKSTYFYLTSSPYDTTPFSRSNNDKLTDTIAVYLKAGEKADQTDNLVTVTGILSFGNYTDSMGKSYSYCIKEACVSAASQDELSKSEAKWQKLSDANIVNRTDAMLRYLEFVCNWPSLTMTVNGENKKLTPDFALYNIEGESSVFVFGLDEKAFDTLIEDIKAVDARAFSDLVRIVEDGKELSAKAYGALKNGEYTQANGQYTLNDAETLTEEFDALSAQYTKWLNGWKL